ncbi:ribosome biogenesis GTP-binding protein YihA/YsxC [soil metagenome]
MPASTYQHAKFQTSAAALDHLPPDEGIEIAFAGRSNAGKSTAINIMTHQNHLARTSKTPGRTQLINIFSIDEERRLVDLPGYGYAKVPASVRERWQNTLSLYLQNRQCLGGLVLLMDIRHPLKEQDCSMLKWAGSNLLPVQLLLTKADKLVRSAMITTLRQVEDEVSSYPGDIKVQCFSALKRLGLDELYQRLDQWYLLSEGQDRSNTGTASTSS